MREICLNHCRRHRRANGNSIKDHYPPRIIIIIIMTCSCAPRKQADLERLKSLSIALIYESDGNFGMTMFNRDQDLFLYYFIKVHKVLQRVQWQQITPPSPALVAA